MVTVTLPLTQRVSQGVYNLITHDRSGYTSSQDGRYLVLIYSITAQYRIIYLNLCITIGKIKNIKSSLEKV